MRSGDRAARALRGALCWLLLLVVVFIAHPAHAQTIDLPESSPTEKLTIAADAGSRWMEGVYEVWLLRGNVYINQGLTYARSRDALLWIQRGGPSGNPPHKVIAYLEGDVSVEYQASRSAANPGAANSGGTKPAALAGRLQDKSWLRRYYSEATVSVRVPKVDEPPADKPAIYAHAMAAREPNASPVRPAQFAEPIVTPPGTPPLVVPPGGTRRVRVLRRSDVPFQYQFFTNDTTSERVLTVSAGVNVIIDGLRDFGSIDLETDRLVMWTPVTDDNALTEAGSIQDENLPLEIYMEGNIVFRQGDRVIEANRMYYDVRRKTGVVLDAELRSGVPEYEGLVRLRAQVLQQIGQDQFVAQDAALTTSRMGVPGYEFKAGTLSYQDIQTPRISPLTNAPEVNPETGEPLVAHQRRVSSRGNTLNVEDVPVLYWPTFATDLEKPTFYVDDLRFKQDKIFGTQFYLDLDLYQIFGWQNPPDGTTWDVSLDYLSKRGFATGTNFSYDRTNLFSIPGRAFGTFDAWGLYDDGLDNLGRNFRALFPEADPRGRVFSRNRIVTPSGLQLTTEIGFISDRNFLEQYFEREWDEFKDQATGLELKQLNDNRSWALSADARINDFFTETQGVKLDHFWLGQPLWDDRLTWYEHTNLGYRDMRVASTPANPSQAAVFELLPWEANVGGERVATRQEIDFAFDLGPVKVVPYALGELAHWGEVLDGSDQQRAFGSLGVRASMPMWSVDPTVKSDLFNLNGLAHKVVFDADLWYTDSNRNITDFPLYDPIEDNNIEYFRRIFKFTTFGLPFGTPAPAQFDPRLYAVRNGLYNNVSSSTTEIADDLLAAKLGVRQRWQTKRGGPMNQHIVDWITLDTEATIFPDATRDNFGETVGLVNYDFKWNIGDRTTIVSDGMFDFFSNGPRYFTVGGFLNRPPRGNLYLGIHSLEGPLSSNVIATSYSYRMSPKWATTFGSTFALGSQGNIGQNFSLTRIGESFLVSLGMNVDASKGNFGATLAIEPRFMPRGRLSQTGGVLIPQAGAFGLE